MLNRHTVIVLVDRLDMATARALQYARTLHPDELRAVHFALDNQVSADLESEWGRLGPDPAPPRRRGVRGPAADPGRPGAGRRDGGRRPDRADHPVAPPRVRRRLAPAAPRRHGRRDRRRRGPARPRQRHRRALPAHRGLVLPPAASGGGTRSGRPLEAASPPDQGGPGRGPGLGPGGRGPSAPSTGPPSASAAGGRSPIGEAQWRTRVRVAGRIKSVRVQPRAGTSNLECVLADDTGKLLLVFQGRRRIPGIQPGARLVVEGMVGRLGPPPGHPQPRLRAHRRSRGGRRADLTGTPGSGLRTARARLAGLASLPNDPNLSVSSAPIAGFGVP